MKTLKDYIHENGLSYSKLSELVGVSPITVYTWVRGTNSPTELNWRSLQKVLSITESYEELFPNHRGRTSKNLEPFYADDDKLKEDFKAFLQLRKSYGYTEASLAAAIGSHRAAISNWTYGYAMPKDEDIKKLSVVLHTNPMYLSALFTKVGAARKLILTKKAHKETPPDIQNKEIEGMPVSLPKPPPPSTGVFVLIIKADNSYFAAGEWMTVKVFRTRLNALLFAKDHMEKWILSSNEAYKPAYETLEKKGTARLNAVSYCIYENSVD